MAAAQGGALPDFAGLLSAVGDESAFGTSLAAQGGKDGGPGLRSTYATADQIAQQKAFADALALSAENARQLQSAFDDIGKSLKSFAIQEAASGLQAIGEAMVGSADAGQNFAKAMAEATVKMAEQIGL